MEFRRVLFRSQDDPKVSINIENVAGMRPVGLKWGTDPVFERVPQIASLSANAKHLTQMPHILPGNDGCEVPDAGTGSSYIVRPAMPEPVGEDLGGNDADMRLGTHKKERKHVGKGKRGT